MSLRTQRPEFAAAPKKNRILIQSGKLLCIPGTPRNTFRKQLDKNSVGTANLICSYSFYVYWSLLRPISYCTAQNSGLTGLIITMIADLLV